MYKSCTREEINRVIELLKIPKDTRRLFFEKKASEKKEKEEAPESDEPPVVPPPADLESAKSVVPDAQASKAEGAPLGAGSTPTVDQESHTAAVLSQIKSIESKSKYQNRELKKLPTNFPKWGGESCPPPPNFPKGKP